SPLEDTLFSWPDHEIDYVYSHDITLKVVDASPDARLTVTRMRVNGSSLTPPNIPGYRWAVPNSQVKLKYTGFIQQVFNTQAESLATYVSSTAGDTMSMRFNASSLLVYGPCGPDNGLMRLILNNYHHIVNTSKPFACSDCLLFQPEARGLGKSHLRKLLIENMDGKTLGINRFELFRPIYVSSVSGMRSIAAASGMASLVVTCIMMMAVYVIKSVKNRRSMGAPHANRRWFQLFFP
ncbi:unnamed protein product, partial [Rhizoctonia solani]